MARDPVISDDERRARVASRHRLVPDRRIDDVAAIADDLVALHSSDPVTVHLAATARMAHPDIARVEAALYDDRSMVRHHAMRRTLWVMTPAVAVAAHASSTRKVAASEWRRDVKRFPWPEARLAEAVERVVATVTDAGPVSTAALGEALPDLTDRVTLGEGTSSEGRFSVLSRALLHAGFAGRVVRDRPGSWNTSQYDWVAPWFDLDAAETADGAADVLGRWLDRFGPGTETDLAWWTGWTKTQLRTALEAVGADRVTLEGGSEAWVAAGDTDPTEPVDPWVALLPGLDPTAMGWKERAWYLDDEVAARVVDRNGNLGPTVWADGRIVGGWAQRPDGAIATELLAPVDDARLAEAIDRLSTALGDERFRVRFPSPNQRDLLD